MKSRFDALCEMYSACPVAGKGSTQSRVLFYGGWGHTVQRALRSVYHIFKHNLKQYKNARGTSRNLRGSGGGPSKNVEGFFRALG